MAEFVRMWILSTVFPVLLFWRLFHTPMNEMKAIAAAVPILPQSVI
jgi:hypothetical protein